MNFRCINQALTHIFSIKYPQVDVKVYNNEDIITLKSSFDDGNKFIDFEIHKNSVRRIRISHKHLIKAEKLFSINKVKSKDFDIIHVFFNQLTAHSNFNKCFKLIDRLQIKNVFRFYRDGLISNLPNMTDDQGYVHLICNLKQDSFVLYFGNYFKLSRDGNFLPIPMIKFFEGQSNEQVFAFNIYNQQIYKVKKELFYFEDLFEDAELFDINYHGDILVDEYLDTHIINTMSKDDPIRQSLITLPRENLKAKIDLISMYLI